MPHEFKNLSKLSPEVLGYMLVGGLTTGVVIIALLVILSRKDRRNFGADRSRPQHRRRKDKRRRRGS